MKVVFDTNVFVAAALKSGFSKDILGMASTNLLILICSDEILSELKNKLIDKLKWSAAQADFYVERIKEVSRIVITREKVNIVKRDPQDNKILECALAGEADLIVTMDQDLIELKNFRGIGVVHPKTLTWTFPEYFKKKVN